MRIMDVRERTLAVARPVRNAAVAFDEMTASVVAVVTDARIEGRPIVGYGLGAIGRYAQGGLLRERFIPRLLAAAPETLLDADGKLDPFRAWDAMTRNEKPGGHGERPGAVGVLDSALWDIAAKTEGVPLWHLLADRFGDGTATAPSVPVYASGGHYDEAGGAALGDEIRSYLDLGYDRVKIKVAGAPLAQDLARIEQALAIVGDGARLAVDANGAASADLMAALGGYGLAWVEEPVGPLDYDGLAALTAGYEGTIATGENLFSLADAQNLARHGGLRPDRDLLQFDIAASYGVVEYLRILETLGAAGWSRRRFLPHAGHLLAFHAAAGFGLGGHEVAPDARLAHGGLHDGAEIRGGRAVPPDEPGIGYEAKPSLFTVLKDLTS
jgi:L-alanine-DL-glutamate epimerase-like enolase superfamily enzyme